MSESNKVYPNIIFLDGVPSKRLGGISQTLYNLFDHYPQKNLFALIDKQQKKEIDESSLECVKIEVKGSLFPLLKKRYISKANPFINKLNALAREIFGIKAEPIKLPHTALLLVCTTDVNRLHAAKIIHQKYKYPLLTYYMDDWTADLKFDWWIGNIDKLVKYTLNNALGRLMISETLDESLNKRYSLVSKPTYIVHNPVKITKAFVKPQVITEHEVIKIIYAGSIWDMHLDALVLVADAIGKLNQSSSKKFELCIYSKPAFWEYNKEKLDKPGVVFGGFVLYHELDEKLSSANLLLVTSSFLDQFKAFSRSSVQTKLTDYMKVGIPVLSVGPTYGACNAFVRKWECGYVWENTNVHQFADFLNEIVLNNEDYQKYAQNAYNVVERNFSKSVVQNQLTQFITSLQ